MDHGDTHVDPKLAALNELHRVFWDLESKLFRDRFADPALREVALRLMADERARGIHVYHQMTIERATEHAATAKKDFALDWAAKGGRTKKGDALQGLIERIVAKAPDIRLKQIVEKLERCAGVRDVVEDITEDEICFSRNGKMYSVPLSRLKDRLTRAKK